MEIAKIIGTCGAAIILIAFILNQLHIWKDTTLKYDITNFIGAVLLIVYAYKIRSYPFAVLNIVWALVSLRDIFIDIKRSKYGQK